MNIYLFYLVDLVCDCGRVCNKNSAKCSRNHKCDGCPFHCPTKFADAIIFARNGFRKVWYACVGTKKQGGDVWLCVLCFVLSNCRMRWCMLVVCGVHRNFCYGNQKFDVRMLKFKRRCAVEKCSCSELESIRPLVLLARAFVSVTFCPNKLDASGH